MNEATARDLEAAVASTLSEIDANPAKPVSLRQGSDMDRLLATGARLLRQKTDEHIAAVSAYEKARIELIDAYRVQMERLKIEAEDHLRSLERAHLANVDSIEKLIAKLKLLREG